MLHRTCINFLQAPCKCRLAAQGRIDNDTGQEDVGASVYYSKVFCTGQPEVIMQVLPHVEAKKEKEEKKKRE